MESHKCQEALVHDDFEDPATSKPYNKLHEVVLSYVKPGIKNSILDIIIK